MIQAVYQWAVSLMVILCVGAIVLFLSPDSSSSKSVKIVVTLCILITFLSPIIHLDFSKMNELTEKGSSTISETESDITEQMLCYAVLEAEELCESFLAQEDCSAEKIKAEADIDDNNCIYICKVTVTLEDKFKSKEKIINEKIKRVFNIDGEFVWLKK